MEMGKIMAFEGAIIGYGFRADFDAVPVLSEDIMVDICMSRDGMTEEEAYEFVDHQIQFWCGAETPIIMRVNRGDE